jgi:hypothetical protein
MSEYIAAATMEGIRRRGRLHKRWRDKTEEGSHTMGTTNRQALVKDQE